MVSHPKTPILNCSYHLLWFYFLTVSSKKKCFSNALGHTLVVLEMH